MGSLPYYASYDQPPPQVYTQSVAQPYVAQPYYTSQNPPPQYEPRRHLMAEVSTSPRKPQQPETPRRSTELLRQSSALPVDVERGHDDEEHRHHHYQGAQNMLLANGGGHRRMSRRQQEKKKQQNDEHKIGLVIYKGFVFTEESASEVGNILSMQSMFATVGSLLAGSAIAVPFSTTFDEIVEAETRLAGQDNGGLASLILWAPLTSAGVGFVAAMVTIKISLSLYIALAACNFPEKGFDDVIKTWVKRHYWLMVAEKLGLSLAIVFTVLAAYFIGIVKYPVNPMVWATFGYALMGLVIIVFVYCTIIHHGYTIKDIRLAYAAMMKEKEDKKGCSEKE